MFIVYSKQYVSLLFFSLRIFLIFLSVCLQNVTLKMK